MRRQRRCSDSSILKRRCRDRSAPSGSLHAFGALSPLGRAFVVAFGCTLGLVAANSPHRLLDMALECSRAPAWPTGRRSRTRRHLTWASRRSIPWTNGRQPPRRSVRQLLDEKWHTVWLADAPRGCSHAMRSGRRRDVPADHTAHTFSRLWWRFPVFYHVALRSPHVLGSSGRRRGAVCESDVAWLLPCGPIPGTGRQRAGVLGLPPPDLP